MAELENYFKKNLKYFCNRTNKKRERGEEFEVFRDLRRRAHTCLQDELSYLTP